MFQNLLQRTLRDNFTTMHSWPWPNLDNVVRGANRLIIVLNHNHSIAEITQPLKRFDHPDIVFRMQPDTGFVEHVQHSHQPGADLR